MIEPQTDLAIFKLFLWRCVECNHMATELNHIVPRSSGEQYKNDWKNKVPMCRTCHDAFHSGGVTDTKIQYLQHKRAERLVAMHKEEYI